MSALEAVETRTFRADDLETVLGTVRDELGADAIVLRQREGIVGGIGGFFGKRCVEVDVECPPEMPARPKQAAMPARAVTDAYTSLGAGEEEPFVFDELGEDDGGELFRSLLGDTSVFASTLSDAIERDVEPEGEPGPDLHLAPVPAFELEEVPAAPALAAVVEIAPPSPTAELVPVGPEAAALVAQPASPLALTHVLRDAGLDLRLAESIVSEADVQLRAFDPTEPFENQVRKVLASRIVTKRLAGGRSRRKTIALVGAPGSGKSSAAARLCEAHAAAGRNVVALSLEPVRETIELARLTENVRVELISADHPSLVDFALTRIARADVVIVDTPGIRTRDEAGWARIATLLRPLSVHETHLLVPATLDAAGVDSRLGAVSEQLRIDRLMITHAGRGGPGPIVSASLRSGIAISATATADRLSTADPYELASSIL